MFDGNRSSPVGVQLGMRVALIVVLMAVVAGCGASTGPAQPTIRVTGHVLAGPTCPVVRPGMPGCDPVPVAGAVEFRQDDRVAASTELGAGGEFAIEVVPGEYTVTVDSGGRPFPTCRPMDVTVAASAPANVDVSCDTGIR